MKLSAILVTINLVAAAAPVYAADRATSDKANWLKKNLAALASSAPVTAPASKPLPIIEVASTIKTPKLRPFMPNRPLPSQKQLETRSPALDPSFSSSSASFGSEACLPKLSGQVSSIYNKNLLSEPNKNDAYSHPILGSSLPTPPSTPKVSLSPLPPGLNLQPAHQPVPEPKVTVNPPELSQQERSLVNELVALNMPGHSQNFVDIQNGKPVIVPTPALSINPSTDASPTPVSSAGPPPFPLNLLPQSALQQLIGHKQQKIACQPAYFGSWHQGMGRSNLPYSGFQHYSKGSRQVLSFPSESVGNNSSGNNQPLANHPYSQFPKPELVPSQTTPVAMYSSPYLSSAYGATRRTSMF
jgi:hypothetical protein